MIDGLQPSAPCESVLTDYDRRHATLYLRLLDAEAARAPWTQVASALLGLDPEAQPEQARAVFESHLQRARWMVSEGHRQMLAGREPA